jgi:hypothetical protein
MHKRLDLAEELRMRFRAATQVTQKMKDIQ